MPEKIIKAICGSPDTPLKISGIEIPCYVLEDERRVLSQSAMIKALGMSRGSSGGKSGDRLAKFISGKSIKPFINNDIYLVTESPIIFKGPNENIIYGYEATILTDICEAVLKARAEGKLLKQQLHIAEMCEILIRGFAKVGIIALVDEATGYQNIRARRALEKYLDMIISKELQKWAKTFPDEFYQELFRLRGWQYYPPSVKKPTYIGKLTNDIVYKRLAPGVLEELKKLNPITPKGYRKHRHHQWLTEDIGHPKLREHLASIITLMKVSTSWDRFYRMLQRALPKQAQTIELLLETEDGEPI